MLYSTQMLLEKLNGYQVPKVKLKQLVRDKKYFQIKRGLYTDSLNISPCTIAPAIYGPSYISFEYALSFYGLIPERVTVITSASYGKHKTKKYETPLGVFSFQDVPKPVFRHGIELHEEDNGYLFATPEKALCDMLYKIKPITSIKKLEILLFDDLRLDSHIFNSLDKDLILFLCPLYKHKNLKLLENFWRKK